MEAGALSYFSKQGRGMGLGGQLGGLQKLQPMSDEARYQRLTVEKSMSFSLTKSIYFFKFLAASSQMYLNPIWVVGKMSRLFASLCRWKMSVIFHYQGRGADPMEQLRIP